MPATANLFTINGNDANDPYLNLNNSGATNLMLGTNEVQEVAVISNAYTAQYGRQAGAQVDYATKSGTNRFHGLAQWDYNSAGLNANDFFNNLSGVPKSKAVSNQYAAQIGGPIKRDKLFFFADTEGIRYVQPSTGYVNLPSKVLQSSISANPNISGGSKSLYGTMFAGTNSSAQTSKKRRDS